MNPTSPHDAVEDDEDQEAAEAAAMAARIDDGSDLMSASASSHGGSSRARLTREEEEVVEEAEEEEELAAVDKILAVKKARGGLLEYEIAWEGEDNEGQPWATDCTGDTMGTPQGTHSKYGSRISRYKSLRVVTKRYKELRWAPMGPNFIRRYKDVYRKRVPHRLDGGDRAGRLLSDGPHGGRAGERDQEPADGRERGRADAFDGLEACID